MRVFVLILTAWMIGAVGIHFSERENPAFSSYGESFWSTWIILFSGVDVPLTTGLGRLFGMLLVVTGIGLVSLFTGTVASVLLEARLRRRDVEKIEMQGHLVICNWGPNGLPLIREVHSKLVQPRRPVVIVHDLTDDVILPDTSDDPAFTDVYIVRGEPTNEIILRRAKVSMAHSVIVLADHREGRHADGKTLITCVAIRNLCRGDTAPSIIVECCNPTFRSHLSKAGADEIVLSDELGLRIIARSALYHGMTRVYQELLTVGRDANEMYVLPVPPELVGRDFVEISGLFARDRSQKQSCLLIGIQRGENMHLNPLGQDAGPVREGDQLILLSRVFLKPNDLLPVEPPVPRVS
ncbi:MAG: TrkA family potassium uptake protein [Isosphaeraceae bacterium]